jgi:plasmid stabilization system protein ParE
MGQVTWSPSSLQDVDQIAEFISRDSADQAALFVTRLMEAADRLGLFPRSGRIIPEIGNPDCREIIYGAYRIMFRVQTEDVWITGVVHGARDWKPEAP